MRACWLTCIFVSLSASSVFGAVDEPVPVMQASALSTEDEALSLKLLQEQSEVLDYLLQDGEYERIRVAHLLSAFIEARVKICTRAGLHHPALPPHLRTETRLNVLQTFYSRLPQLKNLCEL